MDPITLGVAVGAALIPQLAGKLIEKATDPETVARSINWVFLAVNSFLKVRKKEKPADTLIPAPPSASSAAKSSAGANSGEIDTRARAAEEIIKSARQESSIPANTGIKLAVLDEFAVEQLADEIKSLMNQIETYLRNLHFEEEKAAEFGGVKQAPIIVMNTIRLQQEEIASRVLRLNQCMQSAYHVSAPSLEIMAEATKAS
jgi:hypothetical protein